MRIVESFRNIFKIPELRTRIFFTLAILIVFRFGSHLALFGLGIMPYITASIIMQLMTKVSPALEAIAKEGPSGQRKIGQYTRYLTVPICIIQAWFAVSQLKALQPAGESIF